MKYMHFNSSCPYAGLANLLDLCGVDTEDYKIALEMNLPYFLRHDESTGVYQAGASLQSAEWFNLYLNPYGYYYIEEHLRKDQVIQNMKPGTMLGIQVSEHSRHAVIFLEEKAGEFYFLNNKWESSPEPEQIKLSEDEFRARIPETVMLGHLTVCEPTQIDYAPYFDEAIRMWNRLRNDLHEFMGRTRTVEELWEVMNRLFRPLLLDGLSMMQLLEEVKIVSLLRDLQGNYLEQLKKNQEVCLADFMAPVVIDEAVDMIVNLIVTKKSELGTNKNGGGVYHDSN